MVPLLLQDCWRLAARCSGRGTPALPHRHPPNQTRFLQGRAVMRYQPLLQDRGAASRRARALLRAGGSRFTVCLAADGEAHEDLPARAAREIWTTVQVRLNPAYHSSGRVDIWLNGTFCDAYQGPMADHEYGARRNGVPFINAQPRFGIYRDWRAETQTIYFDKIIFWNADPSRQPDWGVTPPPGRTRERPR